MKKFFRGLCFWFAKILIPELGYLKEFSNNRESILINTILEEPVQLYHQYRICDSKIGKYSYISEGSRINYTDLGRFCSVGPGLLCGWGIHPLDGVSTAPMFYSTKKQNGFSFCETDKIEERKKITIGNDVFIGANVTILDGVSIDHGAVIGAGCVVSKNVPAYAVVVGVPMKIVRYRFDEIQINALLQIQWWNWPHNELEKIEQNFFDIEKIIA